MYIQLDLFYNKSRIFFFLQICYMQMINLIALMFLICIQGYLPGVFVAKPT